LPAKLYDTLLKLRLSDAWEKLSPSHSLTNSRASHPSTKATTATKPVTKASTGKRASTGSIPDFSFSGEGVKLGSVMKDSPAEKAGLLKGDVITAFDGKKVSNLREYSELLKQHQPGDVVEIIILREGQEKSVSITLGER